MPPILHFTPMKTITTPSKKAPALNSTFLKMDKLRQIDEKADQAMKVREEQLREKAERAKRFCIVCLILILSNFKIMVF